MKKEEQTPRSSTINGRHECEVAHSGEDALVSLSSQQFDLVISDIVLPHLRGTDLVRELSKQIARIPVVLMTAYTSIPSAVDAISDVQSGKIAQSFAAEGVLAYVNKPFNNYALESLRLNLRPIFPELGEVRGERTAGSTTTITNA